jgi:hypothetical protein
MYSFNSLGNGGRFVAEATGGVDERRSLKDIFSSISFP